MRKAKDPDSSGIDRRNAILGKWHLPVRLLTRYDLAAEIIEQVKLMVALGPLMLFRN
jgi:hypothetical protein